jgi:hypothetical protein
MKKKKNFEKNFSNFFFHFVRIKTSATIVFLFFFSSNGRASILLRSLSFFHFFCRGQQIGELWNANCFIFLGCVFDLIFFF